MGLKIYDYECQQCNHTDEIFCQGQAQEVVDCPVCGAHSFTKLLSAPTLRFGTPNDPNAITAMKELEKIGKKDQEKKERRKRNANGTRYSSNILVR